MNINENRKHRVIIVKYVFVVMTHSEMKFAAMKQEQQKVIFLIDHINSWTIAPPAMLL